MSFLSGLVPARFLTIMAHFIIVIVALWGKHENVEACLPLRYTTTQYEAKDNELTTGLALTICVIGFELLSFMSGLSLFWPFVCLFSILMHCVGSVAMAYFLIDEWDCDLYWLIFSFCVVLPTISEIIVIFGTFVLHKAI